MPVVKRFGGFLIAMYFEDHSPPHVHVVTPDTEALVSIAEGEIFAGAIPAKFRRQALTWIASNREALMTLWEDYR